MASPQSKRCSGTTKAGFACGNKIVFNPKNMGPWRAGHCGRCRGVPTPAMATAAKLNEAYDRSGAAAIEAAVLSGEVTREEGLAIAINGMKDAGMADMQHRHPGMAADWQNPGLSGSTAPLRAREQDLEAVLRLAPPGDSTAAGVNAHCQMFHLFGVQSDTCQFGYDISPSLAAIVSNTTSADVLNAARQAGGWNEDLRTTIIQRLGHIAASEDSIEASMAVAGLREYVRSMGSAAEAAMAALPADLRAEAAADALRLLRGRASKWSDKPEQLHISLATLFADYNEQAAECVKWSTVATGQPCSSSAPRRCQRYTGTGDRCRNKFVNGQDANWCGRCAGQPQTWHKPPKALGLPADYLPLGGSPELGHAEAVRCYATRRMIANQRADPSANVRDPEPSEARYEPEDPSEFTRLCGALAPFASDDESRPALSLISRQSINGHEVFIATDSYRAGCVFTGWPYAHDEDEYQAGGRSLTKPQVIIPADYVSDAIGAGLQISKLEGDDAGVLISTMGSDGTPGPPSYEPVLGEPPQVGALLYSFNDHVEWDKQTGALGSPVDEKTAVITVKAGDLHSAASACLNLGGTSDGIGDRETIELHINEDGTGRLVGPSLGQGSESPNAGDMDGLAADMLPHSTPRKFGAKLRGRWVADAVESAKLLGLSDDDDLRICVTDDAMTTRPDNRALGTESPVYLDAPGKFVGLFKPVSGRLRGG